MIPRIKQFEISNDWKLIVTFDDGFRVCYDVITKHERGLF